MHVGPASYKIPYIAPKSVIGSSNGLCRGIVLQYNIFPREGHPIPLRVPDHLIVDAPIWIIP
jgi:hypothetical protein